MLYDAYSLVYSLEFKIKFLSGSELAGVKRLRSLKIDLGIPLSYLR